MLFIRPCILEKLAIVKYAFASLGKAVKKINDSFSIFAFIFVTMKVITLTCCIFNVVIIVFYLKPLQSNLPGYITSIMADCIMLLVILKSADSQSEEVFNLYNE